MRRHPDAPAAALNSHFDHDLGNQSEIPLACLVMAMKGCNEAAARILHKALKKDDRSYDEIADALGRKGPWLGKIARGERRVRLCDFLALADILGFDPIEAIREIRKAL